MAHAASRWSRVRHGGLAILVAEGRARIALRGGIVLLSVLASALTYLASSPPALGAPPVRLPLIVLTIFAVTAAALPTGALAFALLAGHIAVWGLFVPRPDRPRDLLAPALLAMLLVGIHLAGAAIGAWPPGASIPAAARARWLRWMTAVVAVTLVTAGVGALLLLSPPPGMAVVTVLGLVGLGAGAVAAYVKSQ